MASTVDETFVKALPKAELHAHLTGSINPTALHELWELNRSKGQCIDLEDPLTAIQSGGAFVDVVSFFPLFDEYIYKLVNDVPSVQFVVEQVLEAFQSDGVAYLELRTTPRQNLVTGLTKEAYVAAVNESIRDWNGRFRSVHAANTMEVRLILSVDRKMTAQQADEVVDLAIEHRYPKLTPSAENEIDGDAHPSHFRDKAPSAPNFVVGVDLCGNPTKGDVSTFTGAFKRAKANGLGVTVHFAEVPQSSTDRELKTLLSWEPDRLGHVINVPSEYRRIIEARRLGLELCLSCNVLAGLTSGGYAEHHFREWRKTDCPIALSVRYMRITSKSWVAEPRGRPMMSASLPALYRASTCL